MKSITDKWSKLSLLWKIVALALAAVIVFLFWKVLALIAGTIGVAGFIALLLVPYFIPTIVAYRRKHVSKMAIALVNIFLGWTIAGWFWTLVWALANNKSYAAGTNQQTVIINNVSSHIGSSTTQFAPGDVVNGHRFNGTSWDPIGAD